MPAESRPENPAPRLVVEGASLRELKDAARECTSCHLHENATQTVFGAGADVADMVLVGEQPGDSEDLEGEPFVGPAGRLLDGALEKAGIDRSTTYVTNVVKHFKWKTGSSPSKPRLHAKPNRSEITACRPWLDAEFERLNPSVVVCLGATAAQALLGTDFRVTRDHGRRYDLDGRSVVATMHPAAVLRSRDDETRRRRYDQFVSDLVVAAGLMNLK